MRQGPACPTLEPALSPNDRCSLATASWAEDRRLEGARPQTGTRNMRAGRTLVTWPVSGPQMWIRGPERVGLPGDKARMCLNPGDPTRPFLLPTLFPLPGAGGGRRPSPGPGLDILPSPPDTNDFLNKLLDASLCQETSPTAASAGCSSCCPLFHTGPSFLADRPSGTTVVAAPARGCPSRPEPRRGLPGHRGPRRSTQTFCSCFLPRR